MATLRLASKPELALMKVAQISKAGADFEIVEHEVPDPKARYASTCKPVAFATTTCLRKKALGPEFSPRIPGHEVVVIIDAVGAGVSKGKKGSARHRLARRP